MSDLGYNVWGTIAGAIGTLTLIPIFLTWLQTRLPSTIMPYLLAEHKETQVLFTEAIRDGLITDEEILQFNLNLWVSTMRVDEMSAKVCAAKTWWENVKNWWHGLSGRVTAIRDELNPIRVKLAERNTEERKRLASTGVPTQLPLITNDKDLRSIHSSKIPATARAQGVYSTCTAATGDSRTTLVSDAGTDATQCSLRSVEHACTPSTVRPIDHFISDADLHDVLAFALFHPAVKGGLGGETVETPGSDEKLHNPGSDFGSSHDAIHAGAKALFRILKRVYAMRAQNLDAAADPEALWHLADELSARDDGGWKDV
ncbi:hypothetical protein C8Q73DRAFT_794109 [Cubamyces lactineus]|nr:hypothetical protein C8Q73DRAFT_794109 [Cubamyces lactineus]